MRPWDRNLGFGLTVQWIEMLVEFTEPIMLEDRQSAYGRNVGGVQKNNWRMPFLCGVRMARHAPYYLIDRRSALNTMSRTNVLTADQEMSFASTKAAVAASPPITIVCDALRKGLEPV